MDSPVRVGPRRDSFRFPEVSLFTRAVRRPTTLLILLDTFFKLSILAASSVVQYLGRNKIGRFGNSDRIESELVIVRFGGIRVRLAWTLASLIETFARQLKEAMAL